MTLRLIAILLLAVPLTSAQRLRQVSDFRVERLGEYALDDAGTVAFYIATIDPAGTNPDHVRQLFKQSLPGGLPIQLTTLDDDVTHLDVSDDGQTLLFASQADPLGLNPQSTEQLFAADGSGGGLVQLTSLDEPLGIIEIALSGNGSTALFVAVDDPTGANPTDVSQLFRVGTDGSGLTQLTSATTIGGMFSLAVDDAGARATFIDTRDLTGSAPDAFRDLFGIDLAGPTLTQITASSSDLLSEATLSGNGAFVFFTIDSEIFFRPFAGGSASMLAEGRLPTATDDGRTVFYNSVGNTFRISKVATLTGQSTLVYDASAASLPVVSGDGTRLLTRFRGNWGSSPILDDPDGDALVALDADGSNPEKLADVGEQGSAFPFNLTPDGRHLVFPWGNGDAYSTLDLYLADLETDQMTRVTTGAGSFEPDLSDDGATLIFNSAVDLLDEGCFTVSIFRVPATRGAIERVAPPVCDNSVITDHPAISGDGSTVVFVASGSPVGGSSGFDLYAVPTFGGAIQRLSADGDNFFKQPRVDGTGSTAVYQSSSTSGGTNPGGETQVFLASTNGFTNVQLTMDGGTLPDIDGNGDRVVYAASSDPLGSNPDGNTEIFLHTISTATLSQLTITSDGANTSPRISANGEWVAFNRTDAEGKRDAYRLNVQSGTVERAGGGIAEISSSQRLNLDLAVDDQGSVAFRSIGDPTGTNRDRSREIWIARFDEPAAFRISATQPTVASWDPWPSATAYDLIRGDLDQLSLGSLGVVVCVEDDSVDAIGTPDPHAPLPDRGFFYLRRAAPDGNWGTASDGASERVPTAGDCPN